MKEVKHILHAFLLLLAFIFIFTCLKIVYSIKESKLPASLIDDIGTATVINSKGKLLFQSKCAACHIIGKDFTGPSLCGFESRGPWSDRKNVYEWIRNPQKFMTRDGYVQDLKNNFSGVMMQSFPELTDEQIDEIINYINNACITPSKTEMVFVD